MPHRRTRRGNASGEGAKTKEQLNRDMRQKKLDLFIQQFEKEAQDRILEMERRLEDLLATADRVFKVELLKMPPSLQNTRLADLTSAEEVSAGDVTIAMKTECPEIHQPLARTSSKKVKQSEGRPTPTQLTNTQRKTTAKKLKGGNGAKGVRKLATSHSTGSLRAATAKPTDGCLGKFSDVCMPSKRKLSSVSTSAVEDELSSAAGIVIVTSQGELLRFSDETKEDDINLDLLDDMAIHQINKLMKLMNYLSSNVKIPTCDE